jgi:hypothetical protein
MQAIGLIWLMLTSHFYPDFFTATILEWNKLVCVNIYITIDILQHPFILKHSEWHFLSHYQD